MKQEKTTIVHPFGPIYTKSSKILILGSMPSVKSREEAFYYAHPQNRFWKLLFDLYEEPFETTKEKRIDFLARHQLALWDVIASCEMRGSSDASISNVVINDIASLLKQTKIQTIITTGKTAYQYYEKYSYPTTHIHAISLPSTSPANATMSYDALKEQYQLLITLEKEDLS